MEDYCKGVKRYGEGCNLISSCTYPNCRTNKDDINFKNETMEWINVKDELPTDEVLCLIKGWDDMLFYRVLDYDFKTKEWSDWNGQVYNNVEYWTQLPKPPKN